MEFEPAACAAGGAHWGTWQGADEVVLAHSPLLPCEPPFHAHPHSMSWSLPHSGGNAWRAQAGADAARAPAEGGAYSQPAWHSGGDSVQAQAHAYAHWYVGAESSDGVEYPALAQHPSAAAWQPAFGASDGGEHMEDEYAATDDTAYALTYDAALTSASPSFSVTTVPLGAVAAYTSHCSIDLSTTSCVMHAPSEAGEASDLLAVAATADTASTFAWFTDAMQHEPDAAVILHRMHDAVAHLVRTIVHDSSAVRTRLLGKRVASDAASTSLRRGIAPPRELLGMLLVLRTCGTLLRARASSSTRQVYYMHAAYFTDQREAERAIAQVCALLSAPRHALGIYAAERGYYCGAVDVAAHGVDVEEVAAGAPSWQEPPSLYNHASTVGTVPSDAVHRLYDMRGPGVRFILVVEKDCIFRRLVEDELWAAVPCLIVTGCGMPSLATRAFVWQAYHQLRVPVYGLCDYNPYGMAIMMCYRFGSRSELACAAEAHKFCVPLRWLGLRAADLHTFQLPPTAAQRMGAPDVRKAEALLRSEHVLSNGGWEAEARAYLTGGVKMELESLLHAGLDFLSHVYLPHKIAAADAV